MIIDTVSLDETSCGQLINDNNAKGLAADR